MFVVYVRSHTKISKGTNQTRAYRAPSTALPGFLVFHVHVSDDQINFNTRQRSEICSVSLPHLGLITVKAAESQNRSCLTK